MITVLFHSELFDGMSLLFPSLPLTGNVHPLLLSEPDESLGDHA